MMFKILDLGSKITSIFGLEVSVLVGRFSVCILGMKVLSTGKDMRESLSSCLLVMCIVMGAKDSTGTCGANDPAGINFSH
jgi:hypothetical protein